MTATVINPKCLSPLFLRDGNKNGQDVTLYAVHCSDRLPDAFPGSQCGMDLIALEPAQVSFLNRAFGRDCSTVAGP